MPTGAEKWSHHPRDACLVRPVSAPSPRVNMMAASVPAATGAKLHPDLIRQITGERDLEALRELEVIFNPITEIGGLQRCINLQSLSMIDCGLTRISNLYCIRDTLERLCLCQQNITKIEGLDLPHLKELFLHQNAITKIENLEGCPRLQRLWLSSNRIEKLDNLHCLGSLRELWVQENKISTLSGLDSLVHLDDLQLAGNPITEFKEVQRLSQLPCLSSVSLSDPHFGDCPLVQADGYWSFMLCYLKRVKRIDGVEVNPADRDTAEGAYVDQVLRFNEKIEQVEREHEREIAAIESRRRKNMSHAELLRSKLLTSFTELETLVQEGRNTILQEHQRQRKVREKNLAQFESALVELEKKHALEVDRRIQDTQQGLAEEERAFKHYLAKIEAERDQDLFVCQLHYGSDGKVVCQELCRASADFQFLSSHFLEAQAGHRHADARWQLLRVYRLYNDTLLSSLPPPSSPLPPAPERVFFCAKPDLLHTAALLGFSHANTGAGTGEREDETGPSTANGLLLLCSDPLTAWQLAHGTPSSSETPMLASLLVCRAHVDGACSVTLSWDGTPSTLPGLLTAGLSRFPAASSILRVNYRKDPHASRPADPAAAPSDPYQPPPPVPFFLLLRRRAARQVLPEYHALAGDPTMSGTALRRMEEVLEDLTLPTGRRGEGPGSQGDGEGADLLAILESEMEQEVAIFLENMWEEVEPEAGHRLREADAQVRQREEKLKQLNGHILEERGNQEVLLKSMRSNSGGNSGRGQGVSMRGSDRPGSGLS